MSLLQLYQQENIKNCQTFLAKYMKNQFIGMSIQQKVSVKIKEMNIYIYIYIYLIKSDFVGVNRLFVLVYTNEANNAKRK